MLVKTTGQSIPERLLAPVLMLLIALFSVNTKAETACGSERMCLPRQDVVDFVRASRVYRCYQTTLPEIKLDPLIITMDQKGRLYYSGSEPEPLGLQVKWCDSTVQARANLSVIVAKDIPREWGFRFRPKFSGTFLIVDSFERSFVDGIDVGVLWDLLYWKDLNLNVATGFRSVGVGAGYDITRNFGAYGGYAFSFWTLRNNVQTGLYFGFW